MGSAKPQFASSFDFFRGGDSPGEHGVDKQGAAVPVVQPKKSTAGAIHLGLVIVALSCAGLIYLLVPEDSGSTEVVAIDCELSLFLLFLSLMAGLVLLFLTVATKIPGQVPLGRQEYGGAGEEAEMLGSPEGCACAPTAHQPMGAMYIGQTLTMLSSAALLHILVPQMDGTLGFVSADLYPPLLLFLCLSAGLMLLFLGAFANGHDIDTASFHTPGGNVGEEAAMFAPQEAGIAADPPQRSMGTLQLGLMLIMLSSTGLIYLLVPPTKEP